MGDAVNYRTSLDDAFDGIDAEAARFRQDQRFTPPPGPEPIVLTWQEQEVGVAYGLENVYFAEQRGIKMDGWRYLQNSSVLPSWVTAEVWDSLVSAKQRLDAEPRVERWRTLAEREPGLSQIARGTTGFGGDE